MPCSLLDLPDEVLVTIFEDFGGKAENSPLSFTPSFRRTFTGLRTLSALCLVNRHVGQLATAILYRHITFKKVQEDTLVFDQRIDILAGKTSKSRTVHTPNGHFVRALDLELDDGGFTDYKRLFQALPKLASLYIELPYTTCILYNHLRRTISASFPRLKSVSYTLVLGRISVREGSDNRLQAIPDDFKGHLTVAGIRSTSSLGDERRGGMFADGLASLTLADCNFKFTGAAAVIGTSDADRSLKRLSLPHLNLGSEKALLPFADAYGETLEDLRLGFLGGEGRRVLPMGLERFTNLCTLALGFLGSDPDLWIYIYTHVPTCISTLIVSIRLLQQYPLLADILLPRLHNLSYIDLGLQSHHTDGAYWEDLVEDDIEDEVEMERMWDKAPRATDRIDEFCRTRGTTTSPPNVREGLQHYHDFPNIDLKESTDGEDEDEEEEEEEEESELSSLSESSSEADQMYA